MPNHFFRPLSVGPSFAGELKYFDKDVTRKVRGQRFIDQLETLRPLLTRREVDVLIYTCKPSVAPSAFRQVGMSPIPMNDDMAAIHSYLKLRTGDPKEPVMTLPITHAVVSRMWKPFIEQWSQKRFVERIKKELLKIPVYGAPQR